MAQMYEIPRLNVSSPLAGIAQLYATYKGIQRQQEQDAYAQEKDSKTFAQKQQEIENQKAYQEGTLGINAQQQVNQGRYYDGMLANSDKKLAWDMNPNNPDSVARMTSANAQATNAGANASLSAAQANQIDANRLLLEKLASIVSESFRPQTPPQTPLAGVGAPAQGQAQQELGTVTTQGAPRLPIFDHQGRWVDPVTGRQSRHWSKQLWQE